MTEFVNDRILYVIRRVCWRNILNVQAATEDKCDGTNDSFYEELDHVFKQVPKNHTILLGDFNASIEMEHNL